MAAGLRVREILVPLLAVAQAVPATPARAAEAVPVLELQAAAAAHDGRFADVLPILSRIEKADPARYRDGRFDYLAAAAHAATGRPEDALARYARFLGDEELLDVPARLAAGRLLFQKGEGGRALDLLFPLLLRREGAVARRAARVALDALEERLDAAALARVVGAQPRLATRERRRLLALRAAALEATGDAAGAAALREQVLGEGKRDDAAAVVLAREVAGVAPEALPDRSLVLLVETARAQRDLDLAERLAAERDRRARLRGDAVERWAARFDLGRIRAARGRFADALADYRAVLADEAQARPSPPVPPPARRGRGPKPDDPPGTRGFFARVRFNAGAVLEKLGRFDEAVAELGRVEGGRVGPAGLALLQRTRLEIRRGRLDVAEALLAKPLVAREPGRVEVTLLLVLRRAEAGTGDAAARALAPIEALRRVRRLPEPWLSELDFWRGRVAEAQRDPRRAAALYTSLLGRKPGSTAAELAKDRLGRLDAALVTAHVRDLRRRGETLLRAENGAAARGALLPAALLGDADARDLLRVAYLASPPHAAILLAPELPDASLPALCGDAAACRLLQLGLPKEAEPIVRDARRLDTVTGCLLAARLAEDADAGPAALEAAEALARKVPDDFFLPLAPRSVRRALAPRPFDRLVRQAAAENDVPADLLYAVMRRESRFDHEAASPAAARGLMQLTLPAAGEAARDLNEAPPAYADLYDPARSLRFGARTLRVLLSRFGGDPAPVVAAYNAGAGQTTLWLGGAASASEALLAAISYPETRTYFRLVLGNRVAYRLAASDDPPSAAPETLSGGR